MASDSDSAEDTPFTDCGTSGTDGGRKRRRRQVSVTEMVRRAEGRKAKRPAQSRGSPSPGKPGATLPEAGRPVAEPARGEEPGRGVELNAASLAAIQQMIEASVSKVIGTFETKCEQLEKRISILESEGMDRELELKKMREQLDAQNKVNDELQKQVEAIDANRRLSSLILTCSEFEPRHTNEDIEDRVVSLLNGRFRDLRLTTSDIQAAHRLQKDSKVIVRFVKRRVRDDIYDRRFELARRDAEAGVGPRGGTGGRRPGSLFINESLTPTNRAIYNELLEARKQSNGARVASVFSRRGTVFCRRVKGGANIMVPDLQSLKRVLGDGGNPRPTRSSPAPSADPPALVTPRPGTSVSAVSGRPELGPSAVTTSTAPSAPSGPVPASGASPAGSAAELMPPPVSGDGPAISASAAPSSGVDLSCVSTGRPKLGRSASHDPAERASGGGGTCANRPGKVSQPWR